jgi:hypothetical protein
MDKNFTPLKTQKKKKLRSLVLAEPSDWLHEISISKTMLPFSTWANTLPKSKVFLTLGVFMWKSLSSIRFICPTSLETFQGDDEQKTCQNLTNSTSIYGKLT